MEINQKFTDKEHIEDSKKYEDLINNLSVGVYRNTPGPEGHFLEVNPAMISIFEADSKNELLKHNVSDLYKDSQKRALFSKKLEKYKFVRNEELDLVTLKGKKITASVTAVMKTDRNGVVYFDGIVEDITERKKTLESLKKAHDELEVKVVKRTQELNKRILDLEDAHKAIININEDLSIEKSKVETAKAKDEAILSSIGDGVIAIDSNKRIIVMNKIAEKLLGWKIKEAIGKLYEEVVLLEDEKGNLVPVNDRQLNKAFASLTTTTTTNFYLISKNKIKFPVAITVSPIILDKKIIGAIEVFRDITKEKEIDKAKTEFVSLASHQLRTPLTAINWYVEMLKSGDAGELNKSQKKYLEEIYKGSERMVKLVNDLLNISRIETGGLKVEPEPVDLVLLIKDIIHEIEPWSTALNHEIIFKKTEVSLPKINVDKILMRQVIHNIINNAVRYSPEKSSISVVLEKKDVEYVVRVSDEGIGIPKEAQGRIFEKFFRADNAREVEGEGSGIGMYISKSIADVSGAKLWFESPTLFKKIKEKEAGYGTTFYLAIPISGMKKHEGEKGIA